MNLKWCSAPNSIKMSESNQCELERKAKATQSRAIASRSLFDDALKFYLRLSATGTCREGKCSISKCGKPACHYISHIPQPDITQQNPTKYNAFNGIQHLKTLLLANLLQNLCIFTSITFLLFKCSLSIYIKSFKKFYL